MHSERASANYTNNHSNLDCLRAAAVSLVVMCHLLLYFQILNIGPFSLERVGHWGVLIFFVHTSLVLMFSLERQGGGFRHFMTLRIFRIVPLSAVTTLIIYLWKLPMSVEHAPLRLYTMPHFSISGLLSNLFLVQNITRMESIQSVLWSLPYELQMYLTLPALFWVAQRRPGLLGPLWIGSAASALLIERSHLRESMPYFPWEFPRYIPCFLSGVIAYRIYKDGKICLPAWSLFALIASITVVYVYGASFREDAFAWLGCLAIGVLLPRIRQIKIGWLAKSAAHIAKYSYGVYLTHWFAIWFSFERLGAMSWTLKILVFASTLIGLPLFFYSIIEEPMIRFGRRLLARDMAWQQPGEIGQTSHAEDLRK